MNIDNRITTRQRTFTGAALAGLLMCGLAATAQAQAPASSEVDAATPDQAPAGPVTPKAGSESESDWHVNATMYLWFPGAHGDLTALGYNLAYTASPSDILSHANFAVMGLVGVRYKRLVILEDLLYAPATITHTKVFQLPFLPDVTAKVKHTQFVLTPEVGIRAMEHKKFTVDVLTGVRYWHLSNTLTITPAPPLLQSNSTAKTWRDFLLGARIQVPLSRKLAATIWGDASGFLAGANRDYQIVGALTYKIKPKWALSAGWRYLYVDYHKVLFASSMAQSGIIGGVTYSIN